MKLTRKTLTSVVIGLSAVGVLGSPTLAHNGETHGPSHSNQSSTSGTDNNGHQDHGQSSNSGTNHDSGSNTNVNIRPTVRKNVVDLTAQERSDFVNAVLTLKNTFLEGSTVSVYDQFVAIHVATMGFMSPTHEMSIGYSSVMGTMPHDHSSHASGFGPTADAGVDVAHGNSALLPWHRAYTRDFELALQVVNPNVTIPYWDWTNPEARSTIFSDDFLGGNGQGVTVNIPGVGAFEGGPVSSGYFSEANGWVLNPEINLDFQGESRGSSLTRFMGVVPFNEAVAQADLDKALALDDYLSFRPAIEGFDYIDNDGNLQPGLMTHNAVHGSVGGGILDLTTTPPTFTQLGTMAFISSPYDPVFWLVHSNVDRLWATWQENGHAGADYYPTSGQPYGHNLNDRMWPWDGGQSVPGNIGPGNVSAYLPHFPEDMILTPADMLDYTSLGYSYDTSSSGSSGSGNGSNSGWQLPNWLSGLANALGNASYSCPIN